MLRAMGYPPEVARSAIRISIGPGTTREEIDRFAEAWLRAYGKFRRKAA